VVVARLLVQIRCHLCCCEGPTGRELSITWKLYWSPLYVQSCPLHSEKRIDMVNFAMVYLFGVLGRVRRLPPGPPLYQCNVERNGVLDYFHCAGSRQLRS